ncbi:MAG: hypothetical protein H0U63_04635 [Burkholderiales bacterium]|nr:hypothetical protein [Burkholderiales bacterium]
MLDIVLPVSTFPGLRASEGAGRLINCYAEPMGEGARAPVVRHRSPGLASWGTTARTGFRGGFLVDGVLYGAYSGKLEKWTVAGASTNVGNLTGTKKGFFARNNAATPDKVFVDPDGNIATFTPTTVSSGFDVDMSAVNSVAHLNGYLLFTTGSGQIWATGLNVVTVDALSFTTDQTSGGLHRGVSWGGRFYAFGKKATGIYTDAATSPFPLAKADVIPRGIAGPYCVTGFEDGFSKGLHIVGDDNAVYRIDGNAPTKVSTPDLDRLIEAVVDKTELEMCCYISSGHSFIEVSSTTWTWVYNINNGKWHEREKYLATRSRITQTVYAFSKWLCGDTASGNLLEVTRNSQKEVTDPLICEVWSLPVHDFPQRARGISAFFDFAVGVGDASGVDPIATDPSVEISYSTDGGQTFSIPRIRKLGPQSLGKTRVRVNQIKASGAQGYIWKIVMSDPAHFGLMAGKMVGEGRAA